MDNIRERLNRLWQIPDRQDLFDDCCEFMNDRQGEADDKVLLIKFLSTHAVNGVSSKDLDVMAEEDDAEYCEHCGDTLDKCTGYKCWIR